jgi:hypothetical protein
VPDLGLALPRERNPECGLPSFMQGNSSRPVTAGPAMINKFTSKRSTNRSKMNKSVTSKFNRNKEGSVVESQNS